MVTDWLTCKDMGVVIVNGRFGAYRGVGKTTCDGKSVVDYILCSPKLLYYIICFKVDDFCYLRSDKHNSVNITLKSNNLKADKDQDATRGNVTRTKWNDELENDFIQCMNEDQIYNISQSINELTEKLAGYDEVFLWKLIFLTHFISPHFLAIFYVTKELSLATRFLAPQNLALARQTAFIHVQGVIPILQLLHKHVIQQRKALCLISDHTLVH